MAVFPPFIRPRTFPSVCVIFSEPSPYDNYAPNSGYGRYRRSIFPWNNRRSFQEYQQRGRSWDKSDSYSNSYSNSNNTRTVDREYGLRCVVTLVNEICQLGGTCDSLGNKIVVQTSQADKQERIFHQIRPLCVERPCLQVAAFRIQRVVTHEILSKISRRKCGFISSI